MKIKYFVRNGAGWIKCKKAAEIKKGWLEYELTDGTVGLKQPGDWKKQ
jgi:hypothetical protein